MIWLLQVRFSRPGMVCSGDFYEIESMEPNGLVFIPKSLGNVDLLMLEGEEVPLDQPEEQIEIDEEETP